MKIYFAAAAVLVAVGLSSCTKEGFGGKATLTGIVKHHDEPIPNAEVYIKFDAEELPGTEPEAFDGSVTADASGTYTFEELNKGNYYLYSIGYDSAISEAVVGGVAVVVKGGEINTLDVPVTE